MYVAPVLDAHVQKKEELHASFMAKRAQFSTTWTSKGHRSFEASTKFAGLAFGAIANVNTDLGEKMHMPSKAIKRRLNLKEPSKVLP